MRSEVTRRVEGRHLTTESDDRLDVHCDSTEYDEWVRDLTVQAWGGQPPYSHTPEDFLNIHISVASDDEEEEENAGVNLTRFQTVQLRDFLNRVLDPGGVEREFHELKERLQHEHDTG